METGCGYGASDRMRMDKLEVGIGDSVRPKNKLESRGKYTRQL